MGTSFICQGLPLCFSNPITNLNVTRSATCNVRLTGPCQCLPAVKFDARRATLASGAHPHPCHHQTQGAEICLTSWRLHALGGT
eukprot:1161098-Pelagomonas_calceolata.AAC.10